MMDNVETFYSKSWSSGQVRMILGENTFSVYLNSSMETLEFKASDLRIHREWLDGVWKMADGTPLHETASKQDEANPDQTQQDTKEPMNENISKNISDIQRLTRARAKNLREQNKHVDVAFAMLNEKRIEQSSWFSEQGIPKDCFVPVQFLETVGYSYENLQKPDKKGINILKGWVGEVVRGLIRPNKMWMQDVDIVYGVVHERRVDHFIGVEIHLMENTITIFHCGVHKVKENPLIQKLVVLIPPIKLEMMNEEINFNDIVPFQVKKAEGLPKTKLPFNCGLFVVKMLECRSLGLKKMSSINDDTAMDLRSKLCCEMFDQFMDKDFQEGCRR
ncbi:protein AGENET DOMAIN (AGD)-CONTAINING P1 isoform X1 [Brassica napus]|nr:protein AGENET DOMAIN (AGD)-CONTAINING P1 isoform X1 [Brassica napus]XP_048609595.1 protein AGENET DOMAIN (AGD)-CONTAINING P1 isoform X1 [Brassica napus]XP_048609596.1 protein AGENET DOMAIN (AGD)-CONTAINING P1 isoform X1 [Brassica napus]XP_048609597.1 protein AGENET DOMAIN (AGD)-CONTAINING P1 isoform X1 [Brassica napus]XP_048609598.1 protein AGENET DOMAIN (AGD)-CONTAINING P1 isoform X1 [Brassica napus]XP_048609599.1 protein AGENET DOMAIN (AGD)-CONTAINING P1 isoform X1 [Brassica napus]XP_04